MNLAPILTGCTICRHPAVLTINAWIRDKRKMEDIEELAGVTRQTIWNHKRTHLTDERERVLKEAQRHMQQQKRTLRTSNKDAAVLIRDIGVAKIEDGELDISVGDTLRAQAMLDARAEKGADRSLMLQISQIIGGAMGAVIEGQYRDVTPEAIEDAEEFALLTA